MTLYRVRVGSGVDKWVAYYGHDVAATLDHASEYEWADYCIAEYRDDGGCWHTMASIERAKGFGKGSA